MSGAEIPDLDELAPSHMVGTLVQTALEADDDEKRHAAAEALIPEGETYEQRRRVIENVYGGAAGE